MPEFGPVKRSSRLGPSFLFNVDIVGNCNLRCPSCPVGNSGEVQNPTGYMRLDLLEDILRKAKSECRIKAFELYNWTEPLLHPDLPEMIRIVHSYGVRCRLSTNLNIIKNLDRVMVANPAQITISLSGFFQDSYGVTHQRGDIERVKNNMDGLRRARERAGARTDIRVAFHRYLGNHEEEMHMKAYAESLGFTFVPEWAYLMPLEKVLAYATPSSIDVQLTEQDHDLIRRLAMPLDRSIEVCQKHSAKPCVLRDQQMTINVRGDVMLCCTVFDQGKYKLANFLETTLDELQKMKYRHSMCGPCMNNGVHVLFIYGTEELDEVALENVSRHYPESGVIGMHALRRKEKPTGILRWTRRFSRRWRKVRNALAAPQ